MVEANHEGDGVVRNVQYGVWRDDKEADEGYSKEMVHHQLSKDHYENLGAIPEL